MKLTHKCTLEGVRNFVIQHGKIVWFIQDEKLYKRNEGINSFVVKFPGRKISGLGINVDGRFWVTDSGVDTTSFIEKEKDLLLETKNVVFEIVDQYYYCSENGMGKKYSLDNEPIWSLQENFIVYTIHKEYLIYRYGKSELIGINNISGEKIWQFHLPNMQVFFDGEAVSNIYIDKILGVTDDIVYFSLNIGDLIGLRVDSVELCCHLRLPKNWRSEWEKYECFTSASKSILNIVANRVFGIGNKSYWEIDLKDPENTYTIFDISETLKEKNIEINFSGFTNCYVGDEVVFGQKEFGSTPSKIGLFDCKKRKWFGQAKN